MKVKRAGKGRGRTAKRVLRAPRKPGRQRPVEHIQVSMAPQTRRKCSYKPCGKLYHPKRYWQRFHSNKCKLDDWKARHVLAVVDPFK